MTEEKKKAAHCIVEAAFEKNFEKEWLKMEEEGESPIKLSPAMMHDYARTARDIVKYLGSHHGGDFDEEEDDDNVEQRAGKTGGQQQQQQQQQTVGTPHNRNAKAEMAMLIQSRDVGLSLRSESRPGSLSNTRPGSRSQPPQPLHGTLPTSPVAPMPLPLNRSIRCSGSRGGEGSSVLGDLDVAGSKLPPGEISDTALIQQSTASATGSPWEASEPHRFNAAANGATANSAGGGGGGAMQPPPVYEACVQPLDATGLGRSMGRSDRVSSHLGLNDRSDRVSSHNDHDSIDRSDRVSSQDRSIDASIKMMEERHCSALFTPTAREAKGESMPNGLRLLQERIELDETCRELRGREEAFSTAAAQQDQQDHLLSHQHLPQYGRLPPVEPALRSLRSQQPPVMPPTAQRGEDLEEMAAEEETRGASDYYHKRTASLLSPRHLVQEIAAQDRLGYFGEAQRRAAASTAYREERLRQEERAVMDSVVDSTRRRQRGQRQAREAFREFEFEMEREEERLVQEAACWRWHGGARQSLPGGGLRDAEEGEEGGSGERRQTHSRREESLGELAQKVKSVMEEHRFHRHPTVAGSFLPRQGGGGYPLLPPTLREDAFHHIGQFATAPLPPMPPYRVDAPLREHQPLPRFIAPPPIEQAPLPRFIHRFVPLGELT